MPAIGGWVPGKWPLHFFLCQHWRGVGQGLAGVRLARQRRGGARHPHPRREAATVGGYRVKMVGRDCRGAAGTAGLGLVKGCRWPGGGGLALPRRLEEGRRLWAATGGGGRRAARPLGVKRGRAAVKGRFLPPLVTGWPCHRGQMANCRAPKRAPAGRGAPRSAADELGPAAAGCRDKWIEGGNWPWNGRSALH